MYLTKIELRPDERTTQYALANCQQMHRHVTGLFGTDRKSAEILYRLRQERGRNAVYLYSACPVDPSRLLPGMTLTGSRDLTDWVSALTVGQLWQFDLLAAPMKKVSAEGKKNSQRRILRTEEERLQWLARKAEQSGFRILSVRELEYVRQSGRRAGSQAMYLDAYHYTGSLEIVDADDFRRALAQGIGSGRAYGLGMLLLRR